MTEFVLCADFNIHCFHYSLNYNFCLFCELRAAKIFISQPEDQHGCTRSLFNKNCTLIHVKMLLYGTLLGTDN